MIYRPASAASIAANAGEMRALLDGDIRPGRSPPYRIAVALPTVPTPIFERDEAGARVYRTASGVPIVVRIKPGAPLVNAGVYIVGGVSEESADRAGLTRLMVRTSLKGTKSRSALQIAEEGEMLGGSVGSAAGPESFGWSVSVPSRYAAGAIELLADVVQHCTLEAEALETERAIALSDLVAMRDDMYRYPTQLAMRAAFAGHVYGIPASGSEETLAASTATQIRDGINAAP
jgi:zinc protease